MNVLRYAAFTLDGAGGNPAGVVLDADNLSENQMLAIAAGLGYSESAFLSGPPDADERRLRYFSPRAEVPFCGHATIATALALADRDGTGTVRFTTQSGSVTVDTETDARNGLVATLTSVPTHTVAATDAQVGSTLEALGWAAPDLDPRLPPVVAFGGAHHLVLAAGTRERLADLDYDFAALGRLMAQERWTTVALVHAEGRDLFHARNPFPPGGIVEDPATGAAAAALGGYLRDLGWIDVGETFTIRQGEDMGRPSRLVVTPLATGEVRVGGSGAVISD